MKKRVMTKWVAALRSGKYTQATGALRKAGDSFCCLGVLCDIIDPTKWDARPGIEWYYDGRRELLPESIVEKASLRTDDGYCDTGPEWGETLATLNDEGATFSELAELIEQNWKHL